jgi:hypothetical protein
VASVIAKSKESSSRRLPTRKSIEIIASFSLESAKMGGRGEKILSHQGIRLQIEPDSDYQAQSATLIAAPLPRIIFCL